MKNKVKIIEEGAGRYKIQLMVLETDEGYAAILTGGEKTHVGGTVIAYPLKSEGNESIVKTEMITLPEHKDYFAAERVANYICKELKVPVSVTAGIHIDNATKDEIDLILSNCMKAAKRFTASIL